MKRNLTPTTRYEDEVEAVKNDIAKYGVTPERKSALRKATNRLCAHRSHKRPYERIAQLERDMKRANQQNFKLWAALVTMHILITKKGREETNVEIVQAADAIIRPLTDDAELKHDIMQTS
jgi:hypothetical protein